MMCLKALQYMFESQLQILYTACDAYRIGILNYNAGRKPLRKQVVVL